MCISSSSGLDISTESVLHGQFRDELQIASGQIRLDPAIDALVQFRTKVILPVASFS